MEDRPVTPLMAEVLTGIAQCLVPWYVSPNPPPAAAAPSYGRSAWVTGDMEEERRMAALGEALRPHLVSLLQDIARPIPPEARPRTPSAAPWSLRHEGRLVRHRREPGVWTATPVSCPACGLQGPWSLTSDWRSLELVCDCGASWTEHGLSLVGVCLTGGVIEAFQTP
ncbi:hypothetical protein ACFPM3_17705 [Streptomyces coeruleoprunus]|uniref:Uncharacterized protein n=1 Tax=Streptomyces coeruleoprunus TaxID=285563 RepID=A0ABV9XFE4_9ACTN